MSDSIDSRNNSSAMLGLHIQEIFNNAPIGIFTTTPEGRILSANAAMAKMLGYRSPEELISSITDIASQLYDDPTDRTEFKRLLEQHGEVLNHEYRLQRRDGKRFWGSMNVRVVRGEDRQIVAYQGFITDVTKRRETTEKLRQLEWMLSGKPPLNTVAQPETQDTVYGDLTLLNRDGVILRSIGRERLESIADDYLELLGTSSAIYEANGDSALGIFSSGWCRMLDSASRNLCNTSDDVAALNSGRWLCHESCWTHCSKKAVAESAPVDIACNGGIRMYAIPIMAHGDVVGAINFGYGNPPTDPEQLRRLAKAYQLDLDDLIREAKAYDSRPPFVIELAKRRLHATARLIGSMIETQQAEEALRESEDRLSKTMLATNDGMWDWNLRTNAVYFDPRYYQMSGYGVDEFPHALAEFQDRVHPDDLDYVMNEAEKHLRGEIERFDVEFRFRMRTGDWQWIQGRGVIVERDDEGIPQRFVGTHRDISEHRQVEEALRESEEKYRTLVENAQQGVIIAQANPVRLRFASPAMSDITGYKEDELLAMDAQKLPVLIHEDDRQRFFANFKKRITGEEVPHQDEYRVVRKDGMARWVSLYSSLIDYLGEKATLTTFVDITERKHSEEERERLESQLRQAQKMESVGRLAGGVAHDFNNLLMGIMNYSDLCRDATEPDHPSRKWLDEITREAERSARLTQQLLAFARRQTVAPEILNLNDAVDRMLEMLRRLIGENINLIWRPGGKLGSVKIDASQLDQILANLCLNARDAITGTGEVTIETKNASIDQNSSSIHTEITPGEYVLLSVSDSGHGMDVETLGHAFEPFFTTKNVGEGTGLGLATVYGIIKQNDGFVNIDSKPGQGTTCRIYLPRVSDGPVTVRIDQESIRYLEGNETLLLVEDERSIRETLGMLLEGLGYTVLLAEDPEVSLRMASEHPEPIDLLITDVVMPRMNGRELAEQLLESQPSMKVLYMSGYTADMIAHRGVLDEGIHFLSKPISRDSLAQTVRQLLDSH